MGLWRCQNLKCTEDASGRLAFDFVADKGECPKCGSYIKRKPSSVIKRECIHFDEPTDLVVDNFQRGRNESACDPGKPFKGMATGDPSCVTCPACMATELWKRAIAVHGGEVYAEADMTLVVDLDGQMFKTESEG
jgi:predicted nucleic-acid-binding Zn-ribbon protein